MRLHYTGQWIKWSFMLGFCIPYVGFLISYLFYPIIFMFLERIQDHYPLFYLIFFDIDKLPLFTLLIDRLGGKLPRLDGLFYLMDISIRIEVILMLISGLIGLSLDFEQSSNFQNKEIQKIYSIQRQRDRKPINENQWIKWSFIIGFCLHFVVFLEIYLSEVYRVKTQQINLDNTLLVQFFSGLGFWGNILFVPILYGVIGGILLAFASGLAMLWLKFLGRLEQLCRKRKTDTTEQG